jgi:hypothetical protein
MVKRLKVLPNHTPRLAGAAKPGAGLAFVTAATAESIRRIAKIIAGTQASKARKTPARSPKFPEISSGWVNSSFSLVKDLNSFFYLEMVLL